MYPGPERRRYRRYIVSGTATLSVGGQEITADLVNFGFGGLLLRSPLQISVGTTLKVRVLAFCYPNPFEVSVQVVGGREMLVAGKFLERTAGAHELLLWLEQEHFPWTGTLPPATPSEPDPQERKQPVTATGMEADESLEEIYRVA